METPEYIEGIPTEKNASRKRREIIKDEYIHLIERLQKKRGKKAVFNEFLQTDVYIIMRESEKKASNSAAFNWQSTFAVRHLETIIKEACSYRRETHIFLAKIFRQAKGIQVCQHGDIVLLFPFFGLRIPELYNQISNGHQK